MREAVQESVPVSKERSTQYVQRAHLYCLYGSAGNILIFIKESNDPFEPDIVSISRENEDDTQGDNEISDDMQIGSFFVGRKLE